MSLLPLLTPKGVRRVHPAVARRLRKQGRARRLEGGRFRLGLVPPHSTDTRPLGRSGRRVLNRAAFTFSGPLIPEGVRVPDGRWFRGLCLEALRTGFGEAWRDAASNHHTHAQPLLAFSVGRDPRVGLVTVLAEDHPAAWGLLEALREALAGRSHALLRGGETVGEVQCLSVWTGTHHARGCYVGVVAPDAESALRLVPGSCRVERLGEGGRRGGFPSWKVWTRRRANLPLQVGQGASYGAGLLH